MTGHNHSKKRKSKKQQSGKKGKRTQKQGSSSKSSSRSSSANSTRTAALTTKRAHSPIDTVIGQGEVINRDASFLVDTTIGQRGQDPGCSPALRTARRAVGAVTPPNLPYRALPPLDDTQSEQPVPDQLYEAIPYNETGDYETLVNDVKHRLENETPVAYRAYFVSKFCPLLLLYGHPEFDMVKPSADGVLTGDFVVMKCPDIKMTDGVRLLAAFPTHAEAVDYIQMPDEGFFQVFCKNPFEANYFLDKKKIGVRGRTYEVSKPVVDARFITTEPEAANGVYLEWRPIRGVDPDAVAVLLTKVFVGCKTSVTLLKNSIHIIAASRFQAGQMMFVIRSLYIRGQLAVIRETK